MTVSDLPPDMYALTDNVAGPCLPESDCLFAITEEGIGDPSPKDLEKD